MERQEAMKEALDIVKAQAGARAMTEDEITGMVSNLTASIMNLGEDAPAAGDANPCPIKGMDPKKAITETAVTCLECGKRFKVITKKHLEHHGMTPEQYREKHGYKKTQALACKSLARERRKKMTEMKLWEKKGKKQDKAA
jgi:predicted transcriptional regulator